MHDFVILVAHSTLHGNLLGCSFFFPSTTSSLVSSFAPRMFSKGWACKISSPSSRCWHWLVKHRHKISVFLLQCGFVAKKILIHYLVPRSVSVFAYRLCSILIWIIPDKDLLSAVYIWYDLFQSGVDMCCFVLKGLELGFGSSTTCVDE